MFEDILGLILKLMEQVTIWKASEKVYQTILYEKWIKMLKCIKNSQNKGHNSKDFALLIENIFFF